MTITDANCHPSINFDETELRLGLGLGLPGGRGVDKADAAAEIPKSRSSGKRGFSETEIVDLKLHLSSSSTNTTTGIDEKEKVVKPPAKAQVVGWPPVRSFRKNLMATQKANTDSETRKADSTTGTTTTNTSATALVKVSMDGAPYLRKVDLKMYKSYQELSSALATMFSSFASEKKDLISHSKLTDSRNVSDFVPTYEDKDGDWMLVGDVPWGMFVESCKRMRIMTKGSEALHS